MAIDLSSRVAKLVEIAHDHMAMFVAELPPVAADGISGRADAIRVARPNKD